MKTLLLSALALTVATAPIFGEDQAQPTPAPKQRTQTNPPPQRQVPKSYTPQVQQKLQAQRQALQNKQNVPNQTYKPRTYPPNPNTPNVQNRTRTVTPPDQDAAVNPNTKLPNQNWNRNRPNPNIDPAQAPNPDTTVRNRDWQNSNQNTTNNTTMRNRDWQNRNNTNRNWQNHNTANTFTYQQARSRFNHQHHDRSWWRSHYNRIALFAGGYYFWDGGYWYPAYGYDPAYSTYAYNEPIYGYNDLDPGQVIANVQSALQEQGYYNDQIDGLIGPNTRAALSNFQRDQGLPVTAAIDGPTLQALGLY